MTMASLAACIPVRPVIVAEKTPLENTILGVFERLDEEPALVGATSQPADATISVAKRRVLQALVDRARNADELTVLKEKKIVIERPSGLVEIDRAVAQREGEAIPALEALVARENAARVVIMKGVIALSPRLRDADLPAVRAFFYRLNVGNPRAASPRAASPRAASPRAASSRPASP